MASDCALGIDLGTTSVKIVVVSTVDESVVFQNTQPTDSYVVHNDTRSEQNVERIIAQLNKCVSSIPEPMAKKIIGIGICGQLHGLVCWSSALKPWGTSNKKYFIMPTRVSHHYNWQDNRCTPEFLSLLPKPDSHLSIHTGYGCCTLFWLAKNSPKTIESMNRAGTIADFVVAMLCDLDIPKMSTQSAASWGYFNTEFNEWNRDVLEAANFPTHLLPDIAHPGTVAGELKEAWHNISAGIPVGVALGDLQGSVFAVLNSDDYAICNISTSAQMVLIAKNFHPRLSTRERTVAKIVPYFNGKYLFEAAALNGGNAVSLFVSNLHKFLQQVSTENAVDENSLWKHLIESASEESSQSDLEFSPTFLGERHCPQSRGSIVNMKTDNFNMFQIFRALCKGVIANIRSMASEELLKEKQISKIIATGSALLRNQVLQKELENQYSFPIEYTRSADSPFGAALSMLRTLTSETK